MMNRNVNGSPYANDYLQLLQSSIKLDSPQYFPLYLSEIYSDLLNRVVQSQTAKTPPIGIPMRVFFNYFNVESFIGERIFISIDKDNDGLITQIEFINAFISLYQSDLSETSKFLFNMFDFDKDKIIFNLDVILFLSHLPMKGESWENQIKQIDEINKELSSLSPRESIDYKEYYNIILTKNCKHLIKLLDYFFEVKPFTVEEVNMFKLKRSRLGLKHSSSKGILPVIRSPEKKTAAFNLNKEAEKSIIQLINVEDKDKEKDKELEKRSRYASIEMNNSSSKPIIKETDLIKEDKKAIDDSFDKKTPILRKSKQTMSTKFLTSIKSSSVSFTSIAQDIMNTPIKSKLSSGSLTFSQVKDQATRSNSKTLRKKQSFNEFQKTNYAGTFSKIISTSASSANSPIKKYTKKSTLPFDEKTQLSDFVISDNEEEEKDKLEDWVFKYEDNSKIQSFRKYYTTFIGHSLLFFLTSSKSELLFLYNLTNTFIKGGDCVTINKTSYYPIVINYNITRYNEKVLYFVMDSTRKMWLTKLKTAINNTDINDSYSLSDNLGEGRFGKVKRGVHNRTNQTVAVKVIDKQKLKDKDYELIMKELTIMRIVNHPSLVNLIDYYENDVNIYLVMELLEGGDLIELLQNRKGILTEKEAAKIIKTIGLGIQYMNRFGLLHRDLKPENIILGRKGDVSSAKIIDFGLTRTKTYKEVITDPMGTILYVAPEVLRRKPYDYQVDIWSIGVILYFLLGGILPFDDENVNEDVIGKKIVYSEQEYPKEYFGDRSKGSIALIDKCLTKNPSKRITIDEFLQDNWLNTYSN